MGKKKVYRIKRSKHQIFDTVIALNGRIPEKIPTSMQHLISSVDRVVSDLKDDYGNFYRNNLPVIAERKLIREEGINRITEFIRKNC